MAAPLSHMPTALPGVCVRLKNTFLDFREETKGVPDFIKGSAHIRSMSEGTTDRSPCGSALSTAASTPTKPGFQQNLTPSTLSDEDFPVHHLSLSSTEPGCEVEHLPCMCAYDDYDKDYNTLDQWYPAPMQQTAWDVSALESAMEMQAAMAPCPSYADAPETTVVTTLMIRHIPCRFTQEEVMSHLDALGYAQKYDFFYLPQDIRSRSNLGYAFVNFIDAATAKSCQDAISGNTFGGCRSRKVCIVVPAHIQGLENLMSHFRSTAVMRSGHGPVFLNSALPVPQMELLQPLTPAPKHRQGQRRMEKGERWEYRGSHDRSSRNGGHGGRGNRNHPARQMNKAEEWQN